MIIHDFRNPTNQFEYQLKSVLKELTVLKDNLIKDKQNNKFMDDLRDFAKKLRTEKIIRENN